MKQLLEDSKEYENLIYIFMALLLIAAVLTGVAWGVGAFLASCLVGCFGVMAGYGIVRYGDTQAKIEAIQKQSGEPKTTE